MDSICKTTSKTKASVGTNLNGNTMAIKQQCSKSNNGNIQYSMIVQLLVVISHLDHYPSILGGSKESIIGVENLDMKSGIVGSS